ncbi:MAG: hypothetical protein QGI70_15825 [Paracoccaceae bacterium]|nr:hypothetical protein [Paracoccaceae bacterium]
MSSVEIQLHRLRRHYDVAVKTYDKVSFLDLTHTLRIWTELKGPLQVHYPDFAGGRHFKTGMPCRKVQKASRGCEFIFSYMPGGVITYASRGEIFSGPELGTKGGDFTKGATIRISPPLLEVKNIYFVSKALDQPLIKALKHETIKQLRYEHWLGAEAVRMAYSRGQPELNRIAISREQIIKRVANTMDASHVANEQIQDSGNRFDEPIQKLLNYNVAGLPFPYFIILKIAQDILEVANRHLIAVPSKGIA